MRLLNIKYYCIISTSMKNITPEDNLHAAENLIKDAFETPDPHDSLEGLWDVARMVMGTDNPKSGGCMNAQGSVELLQLIIQRMQNRVEELSPEERWEQLTYIAHIQNRINAASAVAKEVAERQRAVRQSSGGFLAYESA